MKKLSLLIAAVMAFAATAAIADDAAADAAAADEQSSIEASLSADILSAYVSRGQVWNDEFVFQPNFWVGLPYGLEFNLWGTMDLTDSDGSCYPDSGMKWSEFDLEPIINLPIPGVDVALGAIYFAYPLDVDNDHDVYVTVSKKVAVNDDFTVKPSLKFEHRCAHSDDWFIIAKVSPKYALTEKLSLGADVEVGYAGADYVGGSYGSKNKAAFSHAQAVASLSYALTDKLSAAVKGGYSTILDSDMRDDMRARDEEGKKPYPQIDIGFGGLFFNYDF